MFLLTVQRRCFFCGSFLFICVLCMYVILSCLFLAALWSSARNALTSESLVCDVFLNVFLSLSHMVSLVRCGI